MSQALNPLRIALDPGHVTKRHAQLAVSIEPHVAHAAATFADQASMSPGEATDLPVVGRPPRASNRLPIQHIGEILLRGWVDGGLVHYDAP